MRVLIISTLYDGGGAEIQSKFEFDLLNRKGVTASYVTFDPALKTGESVVAGHLNLFGSYSKNYRRKADFLYDTKVEKILFNYIHEFQPDIVHLHQVGFAARSIYSVLKNWPCIQTVHDFSIVCDKGTCILPNGCPCQKGESGECLSNCYSATAKSRVKYYYRRLIRRKIDKERRMAVDKYIAPSACLTSYLKEKGYNAICINNAIDTAEFGAFKKNNMSGKRVILYYGGIRKSKGVALLLQAYEPQKMDNLEIHIIGGFDTGRIEDAYDEESFMSMIKDKKVFFHGKKSHKEAISFLEQVFAVVVPSVWMENYPTTAIEGIYGECIVCGSNRGGVPELVEEKELIFDVTDIEDLQRCLMRLNDMSNEEYNKICKHQLEAFSNRNTPEAYFKRLLDVFEEELKSDNSKKDDN